MPKNIPLKSLYSFITVAEVGSMSQAAEKLNVSHSAISQAIKSLELQLNQPLFNRIGRQVKLNSVGQKYYQTVAPALEQIVQATEALTFQPQDHRITLNMISSLAMHWWIPKVHLFNAFAPQLDIRISNVVVLKNLEQEEVDVALLHGKASQWQDYYCEKLANDELILVGHPDLIPVAQRNDLHAIVSDYPVIMAINERRKADWHIWCQAQSISQPKAHNNLKFISSIQALQATTQQLGVFVTHRVFVQNYIKNGLLIELGQAIPNPYQNFYFVCNHDKLINKNIILLRSWLRDEFYSNT